MNIKKWLGYLAIALVIFFVINNPSGAANTASSIGSTLKSAATSITSFFTQVV